MLPPEIHVQGVPGQFRYDLPVRPLAKLRWFGLIPLIFSIFFIRMPVEMLIGFLREGSSGPPQAFRWGLSLFFLVFIIAGCIPAAIGLCILCGRSRIEWRDGRMKVVELVGPFWRSRRLPKQNILRMDVSASRAAVNDKPITKGPLADLAALMVEFEDGEKKFIAVGYPRDWLLALAQDLSGRIGATAGGGQPIPVELTREDENEAAGAEAGEVVAQPAESLVRCEHSSQGLTLVIPPAGVRRGSKGLIFMAIFWCAFMGLFSVFTFFNAKGVPWFVDGFIAFFWLIGIGLVISSINMGRRQARMTVENGCLRVQQTGLYGAKQWQWRRGEIAAICAAPSGTVINDVPLIELQVHPVSGKKVGFLSGREDLELRWIASELRQVLQVPARTGTEAEAAPPIRARS